MVNESQTGKRRRLNSTGARDGEYTAWEQGSQLEGQFEGSLAAYYGGFDPFEIQTSYGGYAAMSQGHSVVQARPTLPRVSISAEYPEPSSNRGLQVTGVGEAGPLNVQNIWAFPETPSFEAASSTSLPPWTSYPPGLQMSDAPVPSNCGLPPSPALQTAPFQNSAGLGPVPSSSSHSLDVSLPSLLDIAVKDSQTVYHGATLEIEVTDTTPNGLAARDECRDELSTMVCFGMVKTGALSCVHV